MRVLNVAFDDDEWNLLAKAKGAKTWRAFILQLVKS